MNYYYADENNQAIGPITEDQLRVLGRNGSITPDTQVLQEGTSEWCQYGLIAPPPNPPGMTPTQPPNGAPASKPNAKNPSLALLVAFLGAAIVGGSVYYFAKRERKPLQTTIEYGETDYNYQDVKVNKAVDAITGFSTFVLGAPSAAFKSRVKAELSRNIGSYTKETVAELNDNEKDWAGFAVSKVGLNFQESIISKVDVTLAPDGSEFAEAFKVRYGKPVSDLTDFATWEGNNTKVSIYSGYPNRVHIEITSKKVDRFIEEQRSARYRKEKDATEQRAREAAKKF
ncbi:MAG: DUF4339 domain-containing protein [Verrucomicrobiota bacterium]